MLMMIPNGPPQMGMALAFSHSGQGQAPWPSVAAQTVVMLLHAVFGEKHISRFFVGNISDLPEGRESLASAMQQVERTERVLKTLWRERNQHKREWTEQYRLLENQSEQARRTALAIFENLLG